MSFPLNRTRLIRQANPSEASQAPKVRRINIIRVLVGEYFDVVMTRVTVTERIIASKANRAINRCFR